MLTIKFIWTIPYNRLFHKHISRNHTNTRPLLSFACARRIFFPRWKNCGGDGRGREREVFFWDYGSKAGGSAHQTFGRDTITSTRGVIQFPGGGIQVTKSYRQKGSVTGFGYGNAAVACIERPDFAIEQPGQPDFNFADLTSATQFPVYVTGTLEGLVPVADVLVLEIHFHRRARRDRYLPWWPALGGRVFGTRRFSYPRDDDTVIFLHRRNVRQRIE